MKTNKINVVLSLNKSDLRGLTSNQNFFEESRINDNGWNTQNKAIGTMTKYTYSTHYPGYAVSDPGVDYAKYFGSGASGVG